jgi:hypothetical protein
MTIGAVLGTKLPQAHLLDGLDHKSREVVLPQPFAQRRRHQAGLLTPTRNEVLGHCGIVVAGPDGAVSFAATSEVVAISPPL